MNRIPHEFFMLCRTLIVRVDYQEQGIVIYIIVITVGIAFPAVSQLAYIRQIKVCIICSAFVVMIPHSSGKGYAVHRTSVIISQISVILKLTGSCLHMVACILDKTNLRK
mgnify:CR=1 FL=1